MPSGGKPKSGNDEEHEEHSNHEAWAIPYADMLTLLMALFVVLFAVSKADTDKFQEVADAFQREFRGSGGGSMVSIGGGDSILDGAQGGAPAPANGSPVIIPWVEGGPMNGVHSSDRDGDVEGSGRSQDPFGASEPHEEMLDLAMRREAYAIAEDAYQELVGLRDMFEVEAGQAGFDSSVGFRIEARGLVVSIVSDNVLFAAASADLPPEGARLLDIIAEVLHTVPNRVAIEGHSDSRPISTTRFPSNWELSGARAATVLRYLIEDHGFEPDRLTATGYADTRPIAPEDSADGKAMNRRVEIVVMTTASLAPLFEGTSSPSS